MSPKVSIILLGTLTLVIIPTILAAAPKAPSSHSAHVNGVRLEYVDWGGEGEPLLFLAGLGDTPYIYNDLAPEFRAHFHCLGLTRRGYGRSDQPQDGYDLDNLVQDIVAFIDALHLRRVNVVGHSFGGAEVIRLSELHPELLHRVILLDTAYNLGTSASRAAQVKFRFAATGVPVDHVLDSLDNARKFERGMHSNVWSDASEANLREQFIVNSNGSVTEKSPDRVEEAILKDAFAGKWNLTRVPVPALFIFAHDPLSKRLSLMTLDAASKAEIRKMSDERDNTRREQIEAFRRDSPQSRIVELQDTDHRCFVHRREEVLREMNSFLLSRPPVSTVGPRTNQPGHQ